MKDLRALDIILHIGFHKTGTTYLQKHVFPNLEEVLYLGRSWKHKDFNQYFFDFYYESEVSFNADQFRDRFYKITNEVITQKQINMSNKNAIFISHESLHCGPHYFGQSVEEQSKRIKAVFPNAKIIIGVRDQLKMIESHYTNYIHHGGKLTFKSFLKSDAFNQGLKLKLEYHNIANNYIERFGASNVHIEIFEAMFNKSAIQLSGLLEFLNVPNQEFARQKSVNQKLNKRSIQLVRLVNKVLASSFYEQYKSRLRGDKKLTEMFRWYIIRILKKVQGNKKTSGFQYIDATTESRLKSYFVPSNKALAKIINVELNQYGYY